MSLNIWRGGTAGGQPLSQSADVMRHGDIIGVQETHAGERDSSLEIARQLGWHHFQQGGRTAVISRHRIVGATPKRWGGYVELREGIRICVFNCHLSASPYQPYQLMGIKYGDAPFVTSELEAIAWANRARGAQVDRLLQDVAKVKAQGMPFVITGDFNEPSHLDWTAEVAANGRHPLRVRYPNSRRLESLGCVDSFRTVHRNVMEKPGNTWTPTTLLTDPADHHDRIDFVYCHSNRWTVLNAEVCGESADNADKVVSPWPSDHRAVLATLRLSATADEGN